MAFTDYMRQKALGENFVNPRHNSSYLEEGMPWIFLYMQRKSFGTVLEKLKYTLPDCFEDIVKKSTSNAQDETAKKIAKHLQSLPSLRPCIHSNGAFGVEGRPEKLI